MVKRRKRKTFSTAYKYGQKKRYRLQGMWNKKRDAELEAKSLRKSGVYTTKIKRLSYPRPHQKQKGYAVYRQSRR